VSSTNRSTCVRNARVGSQHKAYVWYLICIEPNIKRRRRAQLHIGPTEISCHVTTYMTSSRAEGISEEQIASCSFNPLVCRNLSFPNTTYIDRYLYCKQLFLRLRQLYYGCRLVVDRSSHSSFNLFSATLNTTALNLDKAIFYMAFVTRCI
jgi:hypothetical protein